MRSVSDTTVESSRAGAGLGRTRRASAARRRGSLWAIVLAAGDGTRLAPLIRSLYGCTLPKQFAVLTGSRSLLQQTMERIAPLVPAYRTIVVVGQAHQAVAREQLRRYRGVDVVPQPRNIGTGPGLLLPLSRILAREPAARVAVFPCDHHVPNPDPFLRAVGRAGDTTTCSPDDVTLLGVEPESPETEYGWIIPGPRIGGANAPDRFEVQRFVEKPDRRAANRLFERGALWNTFVSVGKLSAYWRLARKYLPEQAVAFERYLPAVGQREDQSILRALYAHMDSADFSRSVLEKADILAVASVCGSGWSDWGTPERVLQSLSKGSRPRSPRGVGAIA